MHTDIFFFFIFHLFFAPRRTLFIWRTRETAVEDTKERESGYIRKVKDLWVWCSPWAIHIRDYATFHRPPPLSLLNKHIYTCIVSSECFCARASINVKCARMRIHNKSKRLFLFFLSFSSPLLFLSQAAIFYFFFFPAGIFNFYEWHPRTMKSTLNYCIII